MNAFFKGAGAVLRKSWVWSLLLVLSSTLLVWFWGLCWRWMTTVSGKARPPVC